MSLIVKIGADTREFERKMRGLTKDINSVSNKFMSVGKSMTMGVTAPLAGLGTAIAGTGIDFESTMSKVAATMGKPKSEISELETLARDMGKATKFSAVEAADGINYMALAGWDSQKIIEGLPALLDLAAAGGMDLATASDIVTDAMTGMGLEASETGRIVDMMAKTSSSSNTSVEQMGKAMILVAGQSNTLGIEANDLALSLGLMANAGFKGEIAGQHLSAGIRRLVAPTKVAQKALDKYGIEVKTFEDGSLDLVGTIEEMRGKLNGLNKSQKAQALGAIFGADAQKSWAGIINASSEDFEGLKDSIENADGAGKKMSDEMMDNLAGRFEIMKSSLSEVAIQLYEHLKPALEAVVKAVTKFAEWLQTLSPKTQKFLVVMGMIAAAIGPALIAFASLLKLFGWLKAAFSIIGVAAMGSVAIWVAIGVAVAALVTAIIIYWDDIVAFTVKAWTAIKDFLVGLWGTITGLASSIWGGIKTFFSEMWESIKETTSNVWNSIKDFFAEWWEVILVVITGPLGLLVLFIVENWEKIKEYTMIAWEAIKEFLVGIWEGIVGFVKPIFEAIGEIVNTVWEFISGITTTVWDFITQYLQAIWDALVYFLEPVLSSMIEFFSKTWDSIKLKIEKVWNAIKTFFITTVTAIYKFFQEKWNSLKAMLSTVWNAIKAVALSIWNPIKDFFVKTITSIKNKMTSVWNAIKGVLTLVWNSIKSTATSVWNAIKSSIMGPVNQAKSLVSSAFNTLKATVSSIFNSIKSVASSVWNGITSVVMGAVSALTGGVSGAFEGMKSAVLGVWEGIKSGIKTVINGIIKMVNVFIKGFNVPAKALNKVPGVNAPTIPDIPMLATGGTIFGNGQAIVGEAGPELVSKSGSSVKVTPLSAGEKAAGIGGALGNSGGGGETHLVVNLDGKTIARATAPHMDSQLRSRRDSKNRAKGGW